MNNISNENSKMSHSNRTNGRKGIALKGSNMSQGGPPIGGMNPLMIGTRNAQNHMDILKKFRYNFHYWLRNCYQAEDMSSQLSNLDNNS